MRFGLPYHETVSFVRLVEVCQLRGGLWEWLLPMKQSGAALPRPTLSQRCSNDHALLGFICEAATKAGGKEGATSPMLALYAAVVCDVLALSPQVSEAKLRVVVPSLLAAFAKTSSLDYIRAGLMIVSQLASRCTLSRTMLRGLSKGLVRSLRRLDEPLLVLLVLAARNPDVSILSDAALLRPGST
eukprot:jgi/Botrbrau1/2738/Bobra.0164s0018.1